MAVWKSLAEAVASLNWVDEQTLSIGCFNKYLRLFDVRVSGTSHPPLSVLAHNGRVLGSLPSNSNPSHLASYSDKLGESVKIWDVRKFTDAIMTITPVTSSSPSSGIGAIAWSTFEPDVISVATLNEIRSYSVAGSSRAVHTGTSFAPSTSTITSISFQPTSSVDAALFPDRMIVTTSDGCCNEVCNSANTNAVSLSAADNSIGNSHGREVYVVNDGEYADSLGEDVTNRMQRRATSSYGIDADRNLQLLLEERGGGGHGHPLGKEVGRDNDDQFDVWSFVSQVELNPRGDLILSGVVSLVGLTFANNHKDDETNDESSSSSSRALFLANSTLSVDDLKLNDATKIGRLGFPGKRVSE